MSVELSPRLHALRALAVMSFLRTVVVGGGATAGALAAAVAPTELNKRPHEFLD